MGTYRSCDACTLLCAFNKRLPSPSQVNCTLYSSNVSLPWEFQHSLAYLIECMSLNCGRLWVRSLDGAEFFFVGRGSGSQISWHGNVLQNWASNGARIGVAPRHGTTGAVTTCVRKKPAKFVCAWLCVRAFASTPHSVQTITFEPLLAWLYVVGASWRLRPKSR